MTSKNSLFDWHLIMDALRKTLWGPTLAFLGFFFTMPVYCAISLQNYKQTVAEATRALNDAYIIATINNVFASSSPFLKAIFIITAIVSALTFFYFIHSKKHVDFYFSLPIKRGKLFLTNYVAGILGVLIPYLVALLLTLAVIGFNGMWSYISWDIFWIGIACHVIFFICLYTVTVLADILTGHPVIGGLLAVVFLGIGPLVVSLYLGLMNTFYPTFYSSLFRTSAIFAQSSPLAKYISLGSIPLHAYQLWLVILFTALIFFAAYRLFLIRRTEAAGKAVAFALAKPLVEYPLVFIATLGLGLVFYESVGGQNYFWLIFGSACGALISSRIAEIIYRFDFKGIKANFKGLLIFAVCYAVFLCIPTFDLTGYNDYLPEAEDVAEVRLSMRGVNSFNNEIVYSQYNLDGSDYEEFRLRMGKISTEADIKAAIALATTFYAEKDKKFDNYYQSSDLGIQYVLKNGKTVSRHYNSLPVSVFSSQLKPILDSQEFKENQFSTLQKPLEELKIGSINSFENGNKEYLDIGENQNKLKNLRAEIKEEIIQIYTAEFIALSSAQMENDLPVGSLTLLIEKPKKTTTAGLAVSAPEARNIYLSSEEEENYITVNFPIYPGFSKTLSLLEERGVKKEYWQANLNNISKLQIIDQNSGDSAINYKAQIEKYGYSNTKETTLTPTIITDRTQIAAIIKATAPRDAFNYNCLIPYDLNKTVSVLYDNNYEQYYASERYYLISD